MQSIRRNDVRGLNDAQHAVVHLLFERQVHRTPTNVAVVCGVASLTYSQLNARANQLAHHLRALGLQSGAFVGICVRRSVEMVVGVLGILKAGGAWVPMDERYPVDRLGLISEDSGFSFLVTEEAVQSALPRSSARTVFLDREWNSISKYGTSDLPNLSSSADLAYIMYTSGSTGRPKGVMIAHANLSHYAQAMRERLEITGSDAYLHTASIAFSSSVRQLMVPLTSGARVVVATPEDIRQPLSLLATARDRQITIIDLVPSYWRTCIDALMGLDDQTRTALLTNQIRAVLTASEPLMADLPRRWRFDLGHPAEMINMFGQTETTGIATTYTIPAEDDSERQTVPIGYPIANTQIYVLDDQQNQVPAGAVGEIYVGGRGVGSGYLNQIEATAKNFLPNPFKSGSVESLYKTGDMGFYRSDGTLEFVGRVDRQVKIRGSRFELDEIEWALSQHPTIEETAVVVREDEPGNKRVVAYVVSRGRTLSVELVRSFLVEKLPDYMIPSAFVALDSLPRLPNGKLDRQTLPPPARVRPDFAWSCVLPRNTTEWKLVNIWQAVLVVGGIGVLDNFFDLGGDSLSALCMLAQVDKVFGKELPASAVFHAPTIEKMARLLDRDGPVSWSALVPLQTQGSKAPFFWIHGDASDAFLPRYLGPDQPVYGLVHQSMDGRPAKSQTVAEIAVRYLQEIRVVHPTGPYLLGGFCFGGLVAFEIAQQFKAQGDDVRLLALVDPLPLRHCASSPISALPSVAEKPSSPGLRHEAVRHLNNVRRLGGRDRLTYIWLRTGARILNLVKSSTLTKLIRHLICIAYHWLDKPLPYSLRSFYVLEIYRRATKEYALRTYPGSVSLFLHSKTPDENSSAVWAGIATGKVEVLEIPDGHEEILKEPYLRVWAEKLKVCLDTAQNALSQRRI
jgi:amino acid adenylation domain-containing protein